MEIAYLERICSQQGFFKEMILTLALDLEMVQYDIHNKLP